MLYYTKIGVYSKNKLLFAYTEDERREVKWKI